MIDTTPHTVTLCFRIDENLLRTLQGVNPAEICAIGIDKKNEQIAITVIEQKILQRASQGQQVDIEFETKPGFIYIRGMIKTAHGIFITALDSQFFSQNSKLVTQVLNALKSCFATVNDLYLICPDRPVDFLLSKDNTWKRINAPAQTAISLDDGTILASIHGTLQIMRPQDVMQFLETGDEDWQNVIGNHNLGQVAYISHRREDPIITSDDGNIFSVRFAPSAHEVKIQGISQIAKSSVKQVIGPLLTYPNLLAAITEQTSDRVAVSLVHIRQRQAQT